MLAALDFALSLRRILRRIFGRHLRRLRSDGSIGGAGKREPEHEPEREPDS